MTTQRVKSINEKEIYIIGRKYDMLGSGTKMEPGYCNYMGGLVSYNESEIAESQQKSFAEKMEVLQSQLKDTSRVPDTALQDLIDAGFIVPVVGKSISASQEGAAQPLVVKPAKL